MRHLDAEIIVEPLRADCACASFVPPAKSFTMTYSAIVLALFSKP